MVVRVLLGLFGLMWTGYGLWCFSEPAILREFAGVAALNPTGSVDLRATYGGLQVAVGLLLLGGALRAALTRPVLIAYGTICAGVGSARLLGALLESEWSSYTVSGIGLELGTALVVLVLLARGERDVRVR